MVLTDLASKTETVDNRSFQFSYVYNSKGQLETTTYPDSKSIKYEYANGDLYLSSSYKCNFLVQD